jgi:acetyl-CoA carboxylase biotin carboxyl carrier protein
MAKKKPTKTKSSNASPAPKFGGPMDPALLERFVKLMSENDVSALDVSDGSQRISLKRGPQQVAYSAPAQPSYATPLAASQPQGAATSTPAKPQAADDESDLKPIKSPMVGTFYASPTPEAKAFIQVGSVVNEDTDVCIIEAMKVFNNIKAEMRGTIAKICVENGKNVEFGTVLFLVKP